MLWIEAAAAVLGFFIAGELAIRLVLRFRYGRHYRNKLFNYFLVDHPVYGFGYRPNSSTRNLAEPVFDIFVHRPGTKELLNFNINSRGFRGPEFSPRKPPGTLRIFCSGGSTTACDYVNDEETWPAVLERELKARGHKAEVINAGVGAWYSFQERLRFEREIVNYEPDIVLLHEGWNEEFLYTMHNLGKSWRPGLLLNAVELQSMYSRVGRLLSARSSVLLHKLVKFYFWNWRFRRTMSATNPRRWECLRSRAYPEHWFDNLAAMAKFAGSRGIKLYTINCPGLFDFEDLAAERKLYLKLAGANPAFADYIAVSKKRMQKTLRDATKIIPNFDLEQPFLEKRGEEKLQLFVDEFHLNAKGNALLGKLVAEKLAAAGALQSGKSNVVYDEQTARDVREQAGKNYNYLDEYIARKITALKAAKQKAGEALEIPMQRYTTF